MDEAWGPRPFWKEGDRVVAADAGMEGNRAGTSAVAIGIRVWDGDAAMNNQNGCLFAGSQAPLTA